MFIVFTGLFVPMFVFHIEAVRFATWYMVYILEISVCNLHARLIVVNTSSVISLGGVSCGVLKNMRSRCLGQHVYLPKMELGTIAGRLGIHNLSSLTKVDSSFPFMSLLYTCPQP